MLWVKSADIVVTAVDGSSDSAALAPPPPPPPEPEQSPTVTYCTGYEFWPIMSFAAMITSAISHSVTIEAEWKAIVNEIRVASTHSATLDDVTKLLHHKQLLITWESSLLAQLRRSECRRSHWGHTPSTSPAACPQRRTASWRPLTS